MLGPAACVLCSAIVVLGWVKPLSVARLPLCCQEGRRLVTSCGLAVTPNLVFGLRSIAVEALRWPSRARLRASYACPHAVA